MGELSVSSSLLSLAVKFTISVAVRSSNALMAGLRLSALTLWLSLLISLISPSQSQTCTSQRFGSNRLYQHCIDLPQLGSFLHWTFEPSNSRPSLSIAFLAPPAKPEGWIAWAINPTATGMVGSEALIAFRQADGSMAVKTYNISSYRSIVPSNRLSFGVMHTSAEYSGGLMTIFATLGLPDATTLNQVWQVGPSVTNGNPDRHEFLTPNLNSKGKLDLLGGQSNSGGGGGGGDARLKKKNIHGVLNAVSWGIMFPIGIIIARYLRTFESADPAWFYLHASFQFCAYVIGVAGWGTGLKLGSESPGVRYTVHRNLGIALFSLATVQIFALFLRPKKEHKFRFYWNIYHHSMGYAILVLGIVNVFRGLSMLDPAQKWKSAYIAVIAVLGGVALLLEAVTWIVVLRRKSDKSTKPYDGFNNGQVRQP